MIIIVLRTSKLSPTCVLGAFGVDLEKSIFGRFLDPRYLPWKSRKSGIRNFGLRFCMSILSFGTVIWSKSYSGHPKWVVHVSWDLSDPIFKNRFFEISGVHNAGFAIYCPKAHMRACARNAQRAAKISWSAWPQKISFLLVTF